MGPDKAWGSQEDLGARYRSSYPLENFLSEALTEIRRRWTPSEDLQACKAHKGKLLLLHQHFKRDED